MLFFHFKSNKKNIMENKKKEEEENGNDAAKYFDETKYITLLNDTQWPI